MGVEAKPKIGETLNQIKGDFMVTMKDLLECGDTKQEDGIRK